MPLPGACRLPVWRKAAYLRRPVRIRSRNASRSVVDALWDADWRKSYGLAGGCSTRFGGARSLAPELDSESWWRLGRASRKALVRRFNYLVRVFRCGD